MLFTFSARVERKTMDRDRVIKKLVRAAKDAMKQPELCRPSTDGTNWRRSGVWNELHDGSGSREGDSAERAAMTSEERLRHALERCRACQRRASRTCKDWIV